EAERAIEGGLAYLKNQQHRDGSYGTGTYQHGNVAITSLAGLAMMAGGHQPGRGAYGKVVTDALQFVMSQESRETPGYLHSPLATPGSRCPSRKSTGASATSSVAKTKWKAGSATRPRAVKAAGHSKPSRARPPGSAPSTVRASTKDRRSKPASST